MGTSVKDLDSKAFNFFQSYKWPGNVRQLKHTIESAINLMDPNATEISLNSLPQYLFEDTQITVGSLTVEIADRAQNIQTNYTKIKETNLENKKNYDKSGETDVFEIIREKEKNDIIEALFKCNGNVSKTARYLNMHRQSLINKIKKYNIKGI